jgi:hypothetical protein
MESEPLLNSSLELSKKNHGDTVITGKKVEKALWEKSSAYLTTRLIPVIPVVGYLLSPTQDWDLLGWTLSV